MSDQEIEQVHEAIGPPHGNREKARAHIVLDSLAAEIAGLRAQVMHEGERLERAEQERDATWKAHNAAAKEAEARAQKAEAALREIDAIDRKGHDSQVAADMGYIARAALSEEPGA